MGLGWKRRGTSGGDGSCPPVSYGDSLISLPWLRCGVTQVERVPSLIWRRDVSPSVLSSPGTTKDLRPFQTGPVWNHYHGCRNHAGRALWSATRYTSMSPQNYFAFTCHRNRGHASVRNRYESYHRQTDYEGVT